MFCTQTSHEVAPLSQQLPKLNTGVRFSSPAPTHHRSPLMFYPRRGNPALAVRSSYEAVGPSGEDNSRGASSATFSTEGSPSTPFSNSLRAWPRDRASSGSFLPPKSTGSDHQHDEEFCGTNIHALQRSAAPAAMVVADLDRASTDTRAPWPTPSTDWSRTTRGRAAGGAGGMPRPPGRRAGWRIVRSASATPSAARHPSGGSHPTLAGALTRRSFAGPADRGGFTSLCGREAHHGPIDDRPGTAGGATMDKGAEAWMADGHCRYYPPAVFFPSDGVGVIEAGRICADCPVKGECLEYALEQRIEHGVWGGSPNASAGASCVAAARPPRPRAPIPPSAPPSDAPDRIAGHRARRPMGAGAIVAPRSTA